MSNIFYGCSSLISISKWNINSDTNMSGIFSGCLSLSCLPYILIWNKNNVTNMSCKFYGCLSLPLPDISLTI